MLTQNEWLDTLEIGPECDERFVDCDKTPQLSLLKSSLSGVSNLKGNYKVARSNPQWHALIYIIDGELDLKTKDGHQTVSKSHLVTLPAHKPFIMELKAKHLDMVWFHLDEDDKWNASINGRPDAEFCEVNQQIYHLLSMIYYESEASLQRPAFEHLDAYIAKSLQVHPTRSQESQRIWQLQQALEQRLHYNWTVDAMSNIANYSPPHLHRLFQQNFGKSPLQYLIHLRMERAKYLLTQSNWSIEQIGEQVGYSDVFNFSKRFKKSVSLAPGQYRKKFAN
ncbi:AraC family transcriptional regulator [Agaribacter marinus]|uniref:AraC family transcriptional regulator n=1 Tax=Agaribacter marinus TaxID=1431249 RepID=A0AA37SU34_9ALTE|nr:AraC family transcriptional regulator [Agaribacter marinus]GLR69142.1 AraC family transcriptional regulator [Agaribacter marinus]